MGLYGIYGEHTQEACPLYNKQVREYLLSQTPTMQKNAQKYGVSEGRGLVIFPVCSINGILFTRKDSSTSRIRSLSLKRIFSL